MMDKPRIGEVRPAGWFVDRTQYSVARGWMLGEFRRCWTRGPHNPTTSPRWKPVWKYHP
jgi:hypothetical protein